ncbi:MAG: hypothetical protein HYW38_01090, partial [Candidatus Colwellbacteria bacterium]|nr:hypothetical protein [Candidatus Colwellbacteria bacterium]
MNNEKEIPGSILVLLAILAADKIARKDGRQGTTIREASHILAALITESGLVPEDVDVALRRVPGGFYSDDVAKRFSGYNLAGWANFPTSSNEPFVFNDEGRRNVWRNFGECYGEYPEQMRQLVN